ncbi:MAG: polymer-forming cytoskeletal protein [Chloroflexi bacterium]|nr:polymer-forming cytoskeletal protein [Chloroflexota bacterium]
MKTSKKITLFLVLVFALAFPASASADSPSFFLGEDKILWGGNFTLESGEVIDGSLIMFGGNANLEPESTVEGDVVVFGGAVRADGLIEGELIVLGGSVSLGETAVVEGDLVAPGAAVNQAPGAVVQGDRLTELGPVYLPDLSDIPRIDFGPGFNFRPTFFTTDTNFGFGSLMWSLFQTFAFTALAVLVVLFLPKQTNNIRRAVVSQPVISGGVGLLSVVVAPVFLILMTILTLCLLSPLSFLGFIILIAAGTFGWIAIGQEVGSRFAEVFKQDWNEALEAGVGTFALTFVVSALGIIPCIGFILGLVIVSVGVGGVTLTRFGSREYLGASAGEEEPQQLMESEVEKPKPKKKTAKAKTSKAKSKKKKE